MKIPDLSCMAPTMIVGMTFGAMICLMAIADADIRPELACRDGKLYEVSYEQNITIYDPTFNDCEETK